MEKDIEGISLKEIFEIAYHYLWIIVLGIILGLVLFITLISVKRDNYVASGSLLVTTTFTNESSYAQIKSDSILKTINSLIDKDIVIRKTMNKIEYKDSINTFINNYEISHEIVNQFIDISITSYDKDNIIEVLNTLLDSTVEYMVENEALYTQNSYELSVVVTEYATYVEKIKENNLIYFLLSEALSILAIAIIIVVLYNVSKKHISYEGFKRNIGKFDNKINVFYKKDYSNPLVFNKLNEFDSVIIDSYDSLWINNLLSVLTSIFDNDKIKLINTSDEEIRLTNSLVIIDENIRKNNKNIINKRLRKYLYSKNEIIYFLK